MKGNQCEDCIRSLISCCKPKHRARFPQAPSQSPAQLGSLSLCPLALDVDEVSFK